MSVADLSDGRYRDLNQRLGYRYFQDSSGTRTSTVQQTLASYMQTQKNFAKELHSPSPCNGACGNRQEWAGLP
jgi:hypothetical protein